MDRLSEYCARHKLPVTHQKMVIFKTIELSTDHPTLEDVFKSVKKKLATISKATVYKNINKFAEIGLLQIIKSDGIMRIDPNTHAHHHLINEGTGEIQDVYIDKEIPLPKGLTKKNISKIVINYYTK